jgi:predicted transcriptional regulator
MFDIKYVPDQSFYHRFLNKIFDNHFDRKYLFSIINSIMFVQTGMLFDEKTIKKYSINNISYTNSNIIDTDDNFDGKEMMLRLNAIKRNGNKETFLKENEIVDWFKNISERNGFELNDLHYEIKDKSGLYFG